MNFLGGAALYDINDFAHSADFCCSGLTAITLWVARAILNGFGEIRIGAFLKTEWRFMSSSNREHHVTFSDKTNLAWMASREKQSVRQHWGKVTVVNAYGAIAIHEDFLETGMKI